MKFETGQTSNKSQQHTTWCANARNMMGPTMLRLVGQQSCERLHGPLNELDILDELALLIEYYKF